MDEVNETVIVTLSSPSNATLGSDSVHTYTITDNDRAPAGRFLYHQHLSGAESSSSKALTVDVSAASSTRLLQLIMLSRVLRQALAPITL